MTTRAATIGPVRLRGGAGVSVRVADRARQRLAAWRHEAISMAADRLDRRPVLAELLADLGDMHIHGPRLAREVGSPDAFEERVTGQDHTGIAGKRRQ